MEEWRQRHSVGLYPTQAGTWRASTAQKQAHGSTAEEALQNWADKWPVTKCWKAEQLEKKEP